MNEEAAAQDYLLDYLQADDTLMSMVSGVYLRSVPEKAPDPLVKVDVLDREDLMVVNLYRVWVDLTVLVRAVIQSRDYGVEDWSEVRLIADRIDELLHKHEASTSEIEVHSFREESFTDETIEDSKLFLHAGGTYRLRAHAL